MNVLCYGDSNTYGYDPRSFLGDRYPATNRWVDILATRTNWNITNDGLNGRGVPAQEGSFNPNVDCLLIMLGTNDLLQKRDIALVTERMRRFICEAKNAIDQVVLIGVPTMRIGEWVTDENIINLVCCLNERYAEIATELDVSFVDTSKWDIDLAFDGVHFSQDGHVDFADKLYEALIGGGIL